MELYELLRRIARKKKFFTRRTFIFVNFQSPPPSSSISFEISFESEIFHDIVVSYAIRELVNFWQLIVREMSEWLPLIGASFVRTRNAFRSARAFESDAYKWDMYIREERVVTHAHDVTGSNQNSHSGRRRMGEKNGFRRFALSAFCSARGIKVIGQDADVCVCLHKTLKILAKSFFLHLLNDLQSLYSSSSTITLSRI